MTAAQVIKKLMKKKKLSNAELANRMGYKSRASVAVKFYRDQDYKVKPFLRTLDAMGYECVIREKGKYRTKFKLTEDEE